MIARWKVGIGVIGAVALAVGPGIRLGARSIEPGGGGRAAAARILEVYASSPVLVRAGERVRLPVRVVCATSSGDPCRSMVTLGTRSGSGAEWELTRAASAPDLRFDLTAPAARTLGAARSGELTFFVRVSAAGRAETLPRGGQSSPLRFYIARDMSVARAPSIPFGRTRAGRIVLDLPWGSGPRRAGLEIGRESATLAPSSFDVDATGRIYLADPLQDRVAVFARGRLLRQTALTMGARAAVAIGRADSLFVLDQDRDGPRVRRMDTSGHVASTLRIGPGIIAQVRTMGNRALANLLPQDTWTTISPVDGRLTAAGSGVGRPMTGGRRLLRVITERYVRLGLVQRGLVRRATELRLRHPLGELALAEPDGSGGYWVVAHVRSDRPSADQYQVIHVSGSRIVRTFAVGDGRFADTPPLDRFRLGGDGNLYQLRTSSAGLRILRFDLGRGS